MTFEQLGISGVILDALKKNGYTSPTPIQAKAIPALLAGNDVMGGAQTGTGKTAAFTIPVLEKLNASKRPGKNPRALILVPTRELAAQVAESVRTYGRFMKLRSLEVYGGVSINPQISSLSRGIDIVIATPGRLLDHLNQGTVRLSDIEILVLDEADRMLDMGFINDIKKIISLLPEERQNMLFSATLSDEIRKLAGKMLKRPELIEVSPKNTAAQTVRQVVHPVAQEKKLKLLAHLIREGGWYQVLVFTRTKRRAQSLSLQLSKTGIPSSAIHGDKSQGARTRALKDFKTGKIQVLVATDIAARGIDISHLTHVVNYQLPHVAEDYIHRIGRTGRAGAEGMAVSLLSSDEKELLRGIEKLLNKKIPLVKITGFPTESSELPESQRHSQMQNNKQPRGRTNYVKNGRETQELCQKNFRAPGHRINRSA